MKQPWKHHYLRVPERISQKVRTFPKPDVVVGCAAKMSACSSQHRRNLSLCMLRKRSLWQLPHSDLGGIRQLIPSSGEAEPLPQTLIFVANDLRDVWRQTGESS